jgi:hypothetical protein
MGIFQMLIIAVIAVLAVVAISVTAWVLSRRQRTKHLRNKFGPEYDYTARRVGDRRRAESELADREKKVKSLDIRSLTGEEVDRFTEKWRTIQAYFVDDPTEAITDAELLVSEVVEARGYPAADFEQRLTYLSVNHPQGAQNYRAAREITQQQDGHQEAPQEASTERLRQAMNYYQKLINELLEPEVKERFQWQRTTNHPT